MAATAPSCKNFSCTDRIGGADSAPCSSEPLSPPRSRTAARSSCSTAVRLATPSASTTAAGYTRVGVIPRFAADPDGPLIDTVVYYKELA